MKTGLTLVIGGAPSRQVASPPADTSRHVREAQALVEGWLDSPCFTATESLHDLVMRIADAFAARDRRPLTQQIPN
jgi:hypothetical protein